MLSFYLYLGISPVLLKSLNCTISVFNNYYYLLFEFELGYFAYLSFLGFFLSCLILLLLKRVVFFKSFAFDGMERVALYLHRRESGRLGGGKGNEPGGPAFNPRRLPR